MNHQKILITHDIDEFRRELNSLLASGWFIMPNTLKVSVSECSVFAKGYVGVYAVCLTDVFQWL